MKNNFRKSFLKVKIYDKHFPQGRNKKPVKTRNRSMAVNTYRCDINDIQYDHKYQYCLLQPGDL